MHRHDCLQCIFAPKEYVSNSIHSENLFKFIEIFCFFLFEIKQFEISGEELISNRSKYFVQFGSDLLLWNFFSSTICRWILWRIVFIILLLIWQFSLLCWTISQKWKEEFRVDFVLDPDVLRRQNNEDSSLSYFSFRTSNWEFRHRFGAAQNRYKDGQIYQAKKFVIHSLRCDFLFSP